MSGRSPMQKSGTGDPHEKPMSSESFSAIVFINIKGLEIMFIFSPKFI